MGRSSGGGGRSSGGRSGSSGKGGVNSVGGKTVTKKTRSPLESRIERAEKALINQAIKNNNAQTKLRVEIKKAKAAGNEKARKAALAKLNKTYEREGVLQRRQFAINKMKP